MHRAICVAARPLPTIIAITLTAIVTTTVSQFDSERWPCKLTVARRPRTPPPPSSCPFCHTSAAVPFACVCCAHTYTHTRCSTYSFVACFLAHISAPSISSQSYYLITLIIISTSPSCACFFPHTHTTLHVHGAVHACPYHAHIYVLFFAAHMYIPAFILHDVDFLRT